MSENAFAIELQWQYGTETGEQAIASMRAAFEGGAQEISDFGTHVFPRLMPVLEQAEAEQFSAEGHGPARGPWAALSKRYAEWKAVHYPGKPTLERTGKLKAALTGPGANAMRTVTRDSMAFGTVGVEYASFHQTGTRWMPSRPPFDFGPDFERDIEKQFQLGIVDALRAARLEATP